MQRKPDFGNCRQVLVEGFAGSAKDKTSTLSIAKLIGALAHGEYRVLHQKEWKYVPKGTYTENELLTWLQRPPIEHDPQPPSYFSDDLVAAPNEDWFKDLEAAS